MTHLQMNHHLEEQRSEWAGPVSSDDAEMASIRPLLKNTNLEERALKLAYDANKDGWDIIQHHSTTRWIRRARVS